MMVSTAVSLLRRLVMVEGMTPAALADALYVTRDAIDFYLRGSVAVPRLVQIALATFVIEQVPSLVGAGYQLRDQTRASIAYAAGDTIGRASV